MNRFGNSEINNLGITELSADYGLEAARARRLQRVKEAAMFVCALVALLALLFALALAFN